jgi:integrase
MKTIEETLKENRPTLSPSSLRTYSSTLKNLYLKVFTEDDPDEIDVKKFKQYKKILDYLKDVEGNKRKSILSALVVLCGEKDCSEYREVMLNDAKEYNDKQKENKMTETQKENWITQDEITDIFNKHKDEATKLFKLTNPTMNQLQTIQNFIIICLMSGMFIPPRRSTDWTEFKIKNINKDEDNYIDKKYFVFNKYKTSKFYKQQKIEIPNELNKILKKWISINPTDYLLFDSNKNQLTPVKLTQRNNKIYDGKISTNMLRHSFITEKYSNKSIPTLKEINEVADDMGHSFTQHLEYIKTNNEKKDEEIKDNIKISIKDKKNKK